MGYVNNLILRGRLTDAEKIIDAVTKEAISLEMMDLYADALSTKSIIAIERKDYLAGIQVAQSAIIHAPEGDTKDRILSNIGGSFIGYGNHHAAKKTLIPLLSRVHEEDSRQRILINLLEIAAKDGDKPTFERYRQKLDRVVTLPVFCRHTIIYF